MIVAPDPAEDTLRKIPDARIRAADKTANIVNVVYFEGLLTLGPSAIS